MGKRSYSISVFGLGYVGTVTSACLAHKGHRVIGVDTNPNKVAFLEAGSSSIVEPQMDQLVAESHGACRLHATSDADAAVRDSAVSFACVGTPSMRNGKLDLTHVEQVCYEIGCGLARKDSHHTVVIRSTVLPGTTQSVAIPILERSSGKRAGIDFDVCYNPEFMREGTAVDDFFRPPFTILGAGAPEHLDALRDIYGWVPGRVIETSLAAAEAVKYISNAFHALKISFANEVGTLLKHFGVDTQEVIQIFTSDTQLNISSAYLSPGFAFGGSCLPKDLSALEYRARELDLRLPLLEAILPSNREHIDRAVESILRTNKKKIGLLGLSFKAGTDDLRESPQVKICKRLLGEGREIRVWDPYISAGRLMGSNRQFIEEVIPHIGSLLSTNLAEVVNAAEVVVVGTKAADKRDFVPLLRPEQIVIDLVNLEKSRRPINGVAYQGICW